ncbi:MAG: hypothetical protein GQ531_00470 [Sulfurovum sp.]|nr:hypothetical protein [Sulfurovum sp.]
MLALSILTIFALVVVAIIAIEIRNERKYQATRRSTSKKPKDKKPKDKKAKAEIEQEEVQEEEKTKSRHKSFHMTRAHKAQKTQETTEEPKKTKKLPPCTYPRFSHERLVEMGLSDDEAIEFVQELIPQLEEQIPEIEALLEVSDFEQMERATHGIKGSSTNVGTGGVSDLLIEYNTYLKAGRDLEIAKVYFESFKHYINELKNQYT